MKKALSLILALVLCLGLCACAAEPKETEPAGVELTLDNYTNYLNIDASWYRSIQDEHQYTTQFHEVVGEYATKDFVRAMCAKVEVTGASTNFNYNSIKIVGEYQVSGLAWMAINNSISKDVQGFEVVIPIEIMLNIAGDGSAYAEFVLPDNLVITSHGSLYDTDEEINDEFKIIEISGTVSPA